MVSRSLQTLTLVLLLTLVPAIQALGTESDLETLSDLPSTDAGQDPLVPDQVVATPDADVQSALDDLPPIPECRPAVHLTLHWWGGDVLDEDSKEASWIQAETVVEDVATQVPVTKTVTETLWEPSGPLGFLEPVTKVVGYEQVVDEVPHELPLGLFIAWEREHQDWTHETTQAHVTLPVGLPYLADLDDTTEGTVTQVCDPTVPILDFAPSADRSDYDMWSPLPMADGWYTDILSLDVWLATAEEMDLMPWRDDGLLIDSGTPLERADSAVAGYVDGYSGPFPDGTGDDADSGDTGDGLSDLSPDSTTHVPVRTGLAVGGAVASVLGAALAGVMAMRRLRP